MILQELIRDQPRRPPQRRHQIDPHDMPDIVDTDRFQGYMQMYLAQDKYRFDVYWGDTLSFLKRNSGRRGKAHDTRTRRSIHSAGRRQPYVGPQFRGTTSANAASSLAGSRGADLLSLVLAERLVLFYAPSGAGKFAAQRPPLSGPALQNFTILGRAAPAASCRTASPWKMSPMSMFNVLLRHRSQGRRPSPS